MYKKICEGTILSQNAVWITCLFNAIAPASCSITLEWLNFASHMIVVYTK